MSIRKIIKSRLRSLGLTQYWLAKNAGISRQRVSAYLGGRNEMDTGTLETVLDALDLRIVGQDELLDSPAAKGRKGKR